MTEIEKLKFQKNKKFDQLMLIWRKTTKNRDVYTDRKNKEIII